MRRLLQEIGRAARTRFGNLFWVDLTMKYVDRHLAVRRDDRFTRAVITDVRYPNEVYAIRIRGGVVWRIERPGVEVLNHESEHALDGWDSYDRIVKNGGDLEDLAQTVQALRDE